MSDEKKTSDRQSDQGQSDQGITGAWIVTEDDPFQFEQVVILGAAEESSAERKAGGSETMMPGWCACAYRCNCFCGCGCGCY